MKPKNIYGWGGFELSSGDISVGITPSIGGRIMSLLFQGQELLFVDERHKAETFDPNLWNDLAIAKKFLGFRVWGGDKTWVAPQDSWFLGIPPLDLDAAPYTLSFQNHEVMMKSPICRETGLQIYRRICITDNQVVLTEELYNRTSNPLQKGLWNVTQVKKPCCFEIPANIGTFRSYHIDDSSLPAFEGDLSPKEGVIRVDCHGNKLFKIGGMPSLGEVSVRVPSKGKEVIWKKIFNCDLKASYAHRSIVEVFNSPQLPYAEIELHTPFRMLEPDECVRLKQTWQISACPSNL
ncbi:MAG: hypothetical protein WCH62_04570 [Candidatus Omnitrophota bacterium]